jgi:hypothetical protein
LGLGDCGARTETNGTIGKSPNPGIVPRQYVDTLPIGAPGRRLATAYPRSDLPGPNGAFRWWMLLFFRIAPPAERPRPDGATARRRCFRSLRSHRLFSEWFGSFSIVLAGLAFRHVLLLELCGQFRSFKGRYLKNPCLRNIRERHMGNKITIHH